MSKIDEMGDRLIQAEKLLFRCQNLLDGTDESTDMYCEINDYYKKYIFFTLPNPPEKEEWTKEDYIKESEVGR